MLFGYLSVKAKISNLKICKEVLWVKVGVCLGFYLGDFFMISVVFFDVGLDFFLFLTVTTFFNI